MNDQQMIDLLVQAANDEPHKKLMASTNEGSVRSVLADLLAKLKALGVNIPWSKLLQVLLTVLPMILSGQPISAIIAAVLALLGIAQPPTP